MRRKNVRRGPALYGWRVPGGGMVVVTYWLRRVVWAALVHGPGGRWPVDRVRLVCFDPGVKVVATDSLQSVGACRVWARSMLCVVCMVYRWAVDRRVEAVVLLTQAASGVHMCAWGGLGWLAGRGGRQTLNFGDTTDCPLCRPTRLASTTVWRQRDARPAFCRSSIGSPHHTRRGRAVRPAGRQGPAPTAGRAPRTLPVVGVGRLDEVDPGRSDAPARGHSASRGGCLKGCSRTSAHSH